MVGTVSTRSPYFPQRLNHFSRPNVELRMHQANPPAPPNLERRTEKFGTRVERVPTARWDALRDRVAITLMFHGHKNETFFRCSLRLAFSTVALRRKRSAAVSKTSRSNVNAFERGNFPQALPSKLYWGMIYE